MTQYETSVQDWNSIQELAEKAVPLLGSLYRNNTCIVNICDKPLNNVSPIQIIREHRFASDYLNTTISLRDTLPVIEGLVRIRDSLYSTRLDLGKLTNKWKKSSLSHQDGNHRENIDRFLQEELSDILHKDELKDEPPRDVILYGFGRIGRLCCRLLIEKTGGGNKMVLKGVVVRSKGLSVKDDLTRRAQLLSRDSVHGPFKGVVDVDVEKQQIIANGNVIQFIYSSDPSSIDYTAYGIDNAILVDNTGAWRDREGLSQHLKSKGVAQVMLCAPGKGVPNIVAGVNDDTMDIEHENIFSAASCTTNAVVPVLKEVHERFKVLRAHVETIHSYSNDQNLIDNIHKKPRRGRSAALNLVLTTSGLTQAVGLALPDLEGKVTGSSIRVPTPDVSMAVLNLTVSTKTSKQEINEYIHSIALNSRQIEYDHTGETVSTDIIGNRHAAIVDAKATVVTVLSDNDENPLSNVVLYVWYDNEGGYVAQLMRVLSCLSPVLKLEKYSPKEV